MWVLRVLELCLKLEDIFTGQKEIFTSGSDSPKHFMKTAHKTDWLTYTDIYLPI